MDCCDNGIHITEVPIDTVYLDGNSSSHFRVIRDSALIYKNPLKYIAVSLSSFVIDIIFFWIFSRIDALNVQGPEWLNKLFSASVLLPTVMARIVSTGYNYVMNKVVVFRHKGRTVSTLWRYLLLVAAVMITSALLVSLFDRILPVSTVFVKMVVDLVLFLCNYTIQKRVIFRKRTK